MKINNEARDILTNTNNSAGFQIEANALMFQLLSSGVYENKQKAIIRELSCNAYDAHVMAGKPDVPFEVHLPNMLEPWLEIRDYGVGLSEDQIYNLYTVYGRSDKRDSNDVIGGLGIGSKSPFSYTDQFSVESIYDGVKSIYSAFVGEDGSPQITKVHSMKTSDHNGVAVKVSIKSEDFVKFRSEAEETLKWFKVVPIITGAQISLESAVKDEDYFQIESSYWNASDYILMGNVAYKYSPDYSEFPMLNIIKNNKSMVYRFDIGSLSVAASRETLSIDKMTQENLENRFKEFEENALKLVQEKLDAADNLYCDEVRGMRHIINKKRDVLEFNGKKLSEYVIEYTEEDAGFKINSINKEYYRKNAKLLFIGDRKFIPWESSFIRVLVKDSEKYVAHNFTDFAQRFSRDITITILPEDVNAFEKLFKHFDYSIEYMSKNIENGCKPERKPRGQSNTGIRMTVLEDGKITQEKMSKKAIVEWVEEQEDIVYIQAVNYRRGGNGDNAPYEIAKVVTEGVVLFVNDTLKSHLVDKTDVVELSEYVLDDETLEHYNNYHEFEGARSFIDNKKFNANTLDLIEAMNDPNASVYKTALEQAAKDTVDWDQAMVIRRFLKVDVDKTYKSTRVPDDSWDKTLHMIRKNYPLISVDMFKYPWRYDMESLHQEVKDYILMKNDKMKQEEE